MADMFKLPSKSNQIDRLSFYQECKDVIAYLIQQNQKLSLQIQRKDQIIQQFLTEKQQFQTKLENLNKNQSHIQGINKLQIRIKQFNELLYQKDQSIQSLQQQLFTLRSEINKQDQSTSRYNSQIKTLQNNVHRLQQALSLVQEENNILAATLHQKQISSNYQIQQLKKSNQKLIRRMQLFIQVRQQSLLSTIPYQNQVKKLYTGHYQPVKDTQSQQLVRHPNYSHKFNANKQQQLWHSSQQQNPELKSHLNQSIQNAFQKTRSIKTENNKKRTQKALQKLQNKIGKMISRIECSDVQSNKDQL